MPSIPEEHRRQSPTAVGCAVVTVSDTRTLETDAGGQTAIELLLQAGHRLLAREMVPDEPERIRETVLRLQQVADVILITGGTGIARRDQTFETISQLLDKPLPGYGELLRMLSYQEIGPAAMLSRSIGGVVGRTVVLTMPGSPAAVRLAIDKLILPEMGHMVREASR